MGFPVDAELKYVTLERALMEGMPTLGIRWLYPSNYVFDGTKVPNVDGGNPGTSSVPIAIGGYAVPLANAWYFQKLECYISDACHVNMQLGIANSNYQGVLDKGQHRFFYNTLMYSQEGVSLSVRGLPTAIGGNGKILWQGQVQALAISSDLNFSAKNTMMIIGDSNHQGTNVNGATSRDHLFTHIFKNHLNTLGADIRIIEKSIAGKSSSDFLTYKNAGKLDLNKEPSLILYGVGANDTDSTTYSDNLNDFIAYKNRMYPNSYLLVLGPVLHSTGSAKETICASIRTAAASIVSSASNPKIKYINMGAVPGFSANTDTNFTTDDGTTNTTRVHHNKAGHALDGAYLIAQWTALGITL